MEGRVEQIEEKSSSSGISRVSGRVLVVVIVAVVVVVVAVIVVVVVVGIVVVAEQ